MNITILYIATGRYHVYWDGFYATMSRFFLPDCQRHVLLFTDDPGRFPALPDVTTIRIAHLPWPDITLLRYHLFLEHREAWMDADFVFFINANYRFYQRVDERILPSAEEGGLVAALHRFSSRKKPDQYPYERRPESTACIPLGQGRHYVAGGFNGGTRAAFLNMCYCLRECIQKDRENGVTAVWHDESHLNHYLLEHSARILPSTFVWPEEKVRWYNRWRIIAGPRDKRRLGGHAFLRGMLPSSPNTPLISLIIPVYNGEAYLCSCLDSICNQTYHHLEILCVDDGSTDRSMNILRTYSQRDPRLQILEQSNQGAGAARNHGMATASGDYVLFLDCDDLFHPELVARLVEAACRSQADITLCQAISFDRSQEGKQGVSLGAKLFHKAFPSAAPLRKMNRDIFHPCDMSEDLFIWADTCPWNKLFRRKFLERHQLQFPNFPYSEDVQLTACALALAETITLVPRVLIYYRLTSSSISHTGRQRQPLIHFDVFSRLYTVLNQDSRTRVFLPSFYRKYLHATIGHLYKPGTPETMRQLREYLMNHAEPVIHLLTQTSLQQTDQNAFQRYKACIRPVISIWLKPEGSPDTLRECLYQLAGQSWGDMEILFPRPPDTSPSSAILREMEARDPRFFGVEMGQSPVFRGQVIADLSASTTLPRAAVARLIYDWKVGHAPLVSGSSHLDMSCYSQESLIARLFGGRTTTRFNLRLFFIPLWTSVRYGDYSARFLLGLCLYERHGWLEKRSVRLFPYIRNHVEQP